MNLYSRSFGDVVKSREKELFFRKALVRSLIHSLNQSNSVEEEIFILRRIWLQCFLLLRLIVLEI